MCKSLTICFKAIVDCLMSWKNLNQHDPATGTWGNTSGYSPVISSQPKPKPRSRMRATPASGVAPVELDLPAVSNTGVASPSAHMGSQPMKDESSLDQQDGQTDHAAFFDDDTRAATAGHDNSDGEGNSENDSGGSSDTSAASGSTASQDSSRDSSPVPKQTQLKSLDQNDIKDPNSLQGAADDVPPSQRWATKARITKNRELKWARTNKMPRNNCEEGSWRWGNSRKAWDFERFSPLQRRDCGCHNYELCRGYPYWW